MRGAWQAAIHGVIKSQTRLSARAHTHTPPTLPLTKGSLLQPKKCNNRLMSRGISDVIMYPNAQKQLALYNAARPSESARKEPGGN